MAKEKTYLKDLIECRKGCTDSELNLVEEDLPSIIYKCDSCGENHFCTVVVAEAE